VYDTVFESFRDALALYDPSELWSSPPRIPDADQQMLRPAAELVVALFSPRGGAEQVTLALAALTTLAPDVRDYRDRLDVVMRWTEEANALGERGMRRSTSAVDVLEGRAGGLARAGGRQPSGHPVSGAAAAGGERPQAPGTG
jgi:hypothetical protein